MVRNFEKISAKGPKRLWVPKDKIVYYADVLGRKAKPTFELWIHMLHDGKKAYIPKLGILVW